MRTTESSVTKRNELCKQLGQFLKDQKKLYKDIEAETGLKTTNLMRVVDGKYSVSIDILLQFGEALGYELEWKKIDKVD